MDLSESGPSQTRHPWEIVRYEYFARLIRKFSTSSELSVVDVGAGDGYFIERLAEEFTSIKIAVAYDPEYSMIESINQKPKVFRTREWPTSVFDLVVLLDVLEHVQEQNELLRRIASQLTHQNSSILISVPAHQYLFSAHDVELSHIRRYSKADFEKTISSHFKIICNGSVFITPFVIRLLEVLRGRERVTTGRVGSWKSGDLVTRFVIRVLQLDNLLSNILNRVRFQHFGLTFWAVCKPLNSDA